MNSALAPSPVSAPWVWTAEELNSRKDWLIRVTDESLAEIDRALASVKKKGLALKEIKSCDFQLPNFGRELIRAKDLLENGPGVALFRGLPVERYSREDIDLMLWGLGTHLGKAVSQSYRGDVIGEVMDMAHTGDTRRAYRTSIAQNLHIDSTDVVGLLCIRGAKHGGLSLVTSAFAIHNAILAERPDLIPVLYHGYHSMHTEYADTGETPITPHRIPVFAQLGDRMVCNYHARPFARWLAQDPSGQDPKNKAWEALNLFNTISERDSLVHKFMLEPGDLQFLNNRTLLHGRTEFEDYEGIDHKRLLLRLWLSMPDWIELPKHMKGH